MRLHYEGWYMSLKAIVYGELIWDVYPDKRVIGGAPFNFAAQTDGDVKLSNNRFLYRPGVGT